MPTDNEQLAAVRRSARLHAALDAIDSARALIGDAGEMELSGKRLGLTDVQALIDEAGVLLHAMITGRTARRDGVSNFAGASAF